MTFELMELPTPSRPAIEPHQQIDWLRSIIDRLNDDCDQAAEEHLSRAGEIQAELRQIEGYRADAFEAGWLLSPRLMARRVELLSQLDELNGILESRCQSNARAIAKVEGEIDELLTSTAAGQRTRIDHHPFLLREKCKV